MVKETSMHPVFYTMKQLVSKLSSTADFFTEMKLKQAGDINIPTGLVYLQLLQKFGER